MAIILRLEYKDSGNGVYHNTSWIRANNLNISERRKIENELWANRKGPNKDGLGFVAESEYFGFISFKQFSDWFNIYHLQLMANHGSIVLSFYRVKKKFIRVGLSQCVFIREEAVKISEQKLENVIEYISRAA